MASARDLGARRRTSGGARRPSRSDATWVETVLRDEPGDLVIPAPVCAEVDYLLGRRLGRPARLAFLDDLATGRFAVACLEAEDYTLISDLERRYDDLDVGSTDLSVVVLA